MSPQDHFTFQVVSPTVVEATGSFNSTVTVLKLGPDK